jgi:hypothetical protein
VDGYGGAYNLRDVGDFFVCRDGDRLYEELVAALGVRRGVLLHGL